MQAATARERSSEGHRAADLHSFRKHLMAAAAAACITAVFFVVEARTPLPALLWATAFLFLAMQQDIARRRIPNWLTLPALGTAIGLALLGHGIAPISTVAGAATALGVGLAFFAAGAVGAGDVKAAMVLGALWGPTLLANTAFWVLLAGGLMAVVVLVLRGGLSDLLVRWWASLRLTLRTGRLHYVPPDAGSIARTGLPFAVAMGLGCTALHAWGSPWS